MFPGSLVVRIRRSHRRGRGSIPRQGIAFFKIRFLVFSGFGLHLLFTQFTTELLIRKTK